MKIVYLVGSLSSQSINRGLSKVLVDVAPEGTEMVEFPIGKLPLYNRDYDADYPQIARDFKAELESADGVLLITPEHNRMYSAAMANAIEWSSRPWGHWSLGGKPVAAIGASPSGIGTASAQQHLRSTLLFFGSKVMGQPEGYIDATKAGLTPEGAISDSSKEFLTGWMQAFVKFVEDNK
ncbi:MAG: NAD(P)H-dependent oxidoreductase [Ancrocorticia sp.]|jgi:chromate reductase|nr:NAD(P)H-dependent oxidoreductase [Ancrocorticia sp.]MCI1895768.1 NAD(P)H-dependent oxidoreductase [Ancrocorticia sp.]MCI1932762.1 NAD(P)H-dependent oxidoreductase [Ancrocorticia sp.]MCI1964185.1 NAD(P)H-dependent oxidoreductase [Ancrocorticia sp.]MCI2002622.1 NAD(P)H-dependent oxidoreductase [Ancrocorticia sp.]